MLFHVIALMALAIALLGAAGVPAAHALESEASPQLRLATSALSENAEASSGESIDEGEGASGNPDGDLGEGDDADAGDSLAEGDDADAGGDPGEDGDDSAIAAYFDGRYNQLASLDDYAGEGLVIALKSSALALDCRSAKASPNALLQLRTMDNTINQRFVLRPGNDGSYAILLPKSNLALTASGHAMSKSAVHLEEYTHDEAQSWSIEASPDGKAFLVRLHGNRTLCLAALPSAASDSSTGSSVESGSYLVLGDESESARCRFACYIPKAPLPDGMYRLVCRQNTEIALCSSTDSTTGLATIAFDRLRTTPSQRFCIRWDSEAGYYAILDHTCSFSWEAMKGTAGASKRIEQRESADAPEQLWSIVHTKDQNGYFIKSSLDANAVAPSGSAAEIGKPASLREATGDRSQAWLVQRAADANTRSNSGKLLIKTDWYNSGEDSFEAYHPKVVAFGSAWNGYRFWMAYTPYPSSKSMHENPCIAASNDLVHWNVPDGLANPIDDIHDDGDDLAYNSDTHILFNPDKNRLELFWRRLDHSHVTVYRSTSDDGVTWSEKEIVRYVKNRSQAYECYSPAIIYENGLYRMWFVGDKLGTVLYAESVDDGGFSWSEPQRLEIPFDCSELKTWHLDVERTDIGYEALLSAYDEWSNRKRMCLWHSSSPDGFGGWNTPEVIMEPSTNSNSPFDGGKRWDNHGIYRSCLIKIDGVYYVFYGGNSTSGHHGIGLMFGKNLQNLAGNDIDFSSPEQAEQFTDVLWGGRYGSGERISFPKPISEASITPKATRYTYTGKAKKPSVVVKNGSKTLVKGTDYTVEYRDNVDAGEASIVVSGIGNFYGEAKASFEILPAELTSATVAGGPLTYTGEAQKPRIVVKSGSTILVEGVDYTVEYRDNVEAGKASVVVTGTGRYCGEATASFRILRADLSSASLSRKQFTYTGNVLKPTVVTVKSGKLRLSAEDFTVKHSASKSKRVGTYKVTVKGRGNFKGSKRLTYKIKRASNRVTVKKTSLKKRMSASKLKKRARAIALPRMRARFGSPKWTVVAKDKKRTLRLSGKKLIVKKRAKAGTYRIKLRATVAETSQYGKARSKLVTVKVTVKKSRKK